VVKLARPELLHLDTGWLEGQADDDREVRGSVARGVVVYVQFCAPQIIRATARKHSCGWRECIWELSGVIPTAGEQAGRADGGLPPYI
jgi:hypothetical protein